MKINFNVKSAKAWAALLAAIVGAVVSILAALGVVVKQTDTTTLYSTITAILSVLSGLGILTDTNKPTGGDQVDQ